MGEPWARPDSSGVRGGVGARPRSAGADFPYDWSEVAEAVGVPFSSHISSGGHFEMDIPLASPEDTTPDDDEIERAGSGDPDYERNVWEIVNHVVEMILARGDDSGGHVEHDEDDLPAERTWRGLSPPSVGGDCL